MLSKREAITERWKASVCFTQRSQPFDNQRVVLPNAGLSNANITNASAFDTRRVDLIVSAGCDTDSSAVHAAIERVVKAQKYALNEPGGLHPPE